ncbi:MAG TPA: L,D-transpeptidase family protein, partial [Anaerolineaceae bacterium]
ADHAGALAGGVLRVETRAVAPAVRDATAQAEQLNAMLRMPLQISAFDPVTGETLDITVPTEALAQMVRVSESGGQPQISLDEAALQAYLQNWQGDLGAERYLDEEQGLENLAQNWQSGAPLQALVRYYPTQYTVQPGDTLLSISYEIGIPWFLIRDANPGSGTNGLVAGEQITLPAKDANLPLPVVRGKRIVISISQQRLWSYENGQLRTQSVISTGIARSPTMPGVFQVRSHEINAYASNWDLWMPNFMGIYEASPGFMNGIHGLPLLSSGVRLWGDVLGSPASYGCIIMTLQEAEELYNWADEGTVVEIQP